MRYLSVCSGIEAATVGWHPLGWTPVAYSEIEPFPCKVLAHHYPNTPNLGDMTKFKEWPDYDDIDLLVGGTPCQSFSVAGLRKGLDDPRGNLMLTYLAIADRYKPRYLCWENVPGVLSSNGGRDFGTFLGAMEKLGYGFAYRVLDAQYCRTDGYPYAVPQRRRRVFVVGCLGDWGRAAAVLFDSESLRGNPPPRREAGQSVTHATPVGIGEGGEVGHCLRSGASRADKHESTTYVMSHGQANAEITAGYAPTLNCNHEQPIALVGNTIGRQPHNGGNGTGFDASGTMYTLTKTDVHAVAFKIRGGCEGGGKGYLGSEESAFTLSTTHDQDVAIGWSEELTAHEGVAGTIQRGGDGGRHDGVMTPQMQVRRLTPTECARLQGFPDDYLPQVPGYSDSAAYKALGNSMAVNVMQLIGQRIKYVESVL